MMERKGSITILFLLLLVAVVGVGAMAVDFALIESARTDLRVTSDLASRAAMVEFVETTSVSSARAVAKQVARNNGVVLSDFALRDADIVPGNSSPQNDNKYAFSANQQPFNSFRVSANMNSTSESGALPMLFSNVHKRATVELSQTATATETYIDIVLVLDRSGSMSFDMSGVDWSYPSGLSWESEYYRAPQSGSRWQSLEGAIGVFIAEMEAKTKPENVALVTYSSTVTYYSNYFNSYFSAVEVQTDQGFTENYNQILSAVASLGNEAVIGGTAISSGIDQAITLMGTSDRDSYSEKVIILLTDGEWNTGYDPVAAAATAASENIKIHTVSFGSGAGSEVMAQVSATTGGIAFDAPGDAELSEAFREIAQSIGLSYTE